MLLSRLSRCLPPDFAALPSLSSVKKVLHLSLLLATFYASLSIGVSLNNYSLTTSGNFCYFFYPKSCSASNSRCGLAPTTFDSDRLCKIKRRDEARESVARILGNYDGIGDDKQTTLARYKTDDARVRKGVVMIAHTRSQNGPSGAKVKSYDLTPENLGPLDDRVHDSLSVRSFYASLDKFVLDFDLLDERSNGDGWYVWNVKVVYEDVNDSDLVVRVFPSIAAAPPLKRYSSLWCLSIATLALSCAASLIVMLQLAGSASLSAKCARLVSTDETMFNRLPPALQAKLHPSLAGSRSQTLWDVIPARMYLTFFDPWDVLMLLSCAASIPCSLHAISSDGLLTVSTNQCLLGISCCFLSLTTVKYVSYSSNYAIVRIMKMASPQVFSFLVGALPGFVAFGMLGTTVFSSCSNRFSSLPNSLTTLFSLMNGDIILETLNILRVNYPFFGPFYICSFLFLYTYFFLDLVLTVVEESLWLLNFEAKRRQRIVESSMGGSLRQSRSSAALLRDSLFRSSRLSMNTRGSRGSSISDVGAIAVPVVNMTTSEYVCGLMGIASAYENYENCSPASEGEREGSREFKDAASMLGLAVPFLAASMIFLSFVMNLF